MPDRVIAIGDIHGCSMALDKLVDVARPAAGDTVVTLGDYINRGPDSRAVIDKLIRLRRRCTLVPLLGNHEEMLLQNREARTIVPGGCRKDPQNELELFRDEHFAFLETCVLHYETDTHFFVHANYKPKVKLAEQDRYTLLWLPLHGHVPRRHQSRKIAVVGHTAQHGGEILNRPHLKCIDTYCHGGGWLTALDVQSGRVWQVNRNGIERRVE